MWTSKHSGPNHAQSRGRLFSLRPAQSSEDELLDCMTRLLMYVPGWTSIQFASFLCLEQLSNVTSGASPRTFYIIGLEIQKQVTVLKRSELNEY